MYQQQKKILSHHPSQDVELLNSRKRLYCEESQIQSENLADDNSDQAILQFCREIDKRFKISVINKLYTFPRRFEKVSDLLSSDQQDSFQYDQKTEPLKPLLTNFQPQDVQNNEFFQQQAPFKKKNKIHTHRSRSSQKKKPKSRNESIKKNSTKLNAKNSNNLSSFKLRAETQYTNVSQASKKKPKHQYQNSNVSNVSYEKKSKLKHKKNAQSDFQYNKMQRLKTEPDASSSFLDTVRNKFSKKNNKDIF